MCTLMSVNGHSQAHGQAYSKRNLVLDGNFNA